MKDIRLSETTIKALSKKSTITLVAGKARVFSTQDPDFVRADIGELCDSDLVTKRGKKMQAYRPAQPLHFLLKMWLIIVVGAMMSVGGSAFAEINPSLLSGLKARNIGPAGMSGRIAAIDVVEADTNIIYVGAASGGV